MPNINLRTIPWKLAVCKLTAEHIPSWANKSGFLSYTKTADEYSLVCDSRSQMKMMDFYSYD